MTEKAQVQFGVSVLSVLALTVVLHFLSQRSWIDGPEGSQNQSDASNSTERWTVEHVFNLKDGDAPPLVIPTWMDHLPGRGYLVSDRSDRDIKVYGEFGERVSVIGTAGYRAGQFSGLTSAVELDGMVVGFDFPDSRLVFFDGTGQVLRQVSLDQRKHGQPMYVRNFGAETLLLVRHPIDRRTRRLLAFVNPEGVILSEFLDLSWYFGDSAVLRRVSPIRADGLGSCVFAATSSQDSVWVFGPTGKMISAGVVDPDHRWPSLRDYFTEYGNDSIRAPFPDGAPYLARLVTLPGCRAAVQVARYGEIPWKLDSFPGGVVVILEAKAGRVYPIGRVEIDGCLIGRTALGDPAVLNRPDDPAADFSVSVLRPLSGG